MPRMIELIREAAVPSNIVRAASRGALALPPGEMIEILVYLTNNPVFAEQARMTLAGWDEAASLAAAGDPQTPPAVLNYFMAPRNWRPRLVPALLENLSVAKALLVEMAQAAPRGILEMMLASPRVMKAEAVLHALASNDNLSDDESRRVQAALHELGEVAAEEDKDGSRYEVEHAAEIAAEEGKPFQLVGDILDLGFGDKDYVAALASGGPSAVPVISVAAALERKVQEQHEDPKVRERISTLQRIANLSVGDRVQLALKGNRQERFILVRDGARVVANAVLESPKLTENEVEVYASMKNVQETVLRTIAMKRKFIKMYPVVRALVSNPRTPLDVALPLLNHILVNDLKHLSVNKNVPDMIRKLGLKLFRQKTGPSR